MALPKVSPLSVSTTYLRPGEPTCGVDLFFAAWDECVELQCQPRHVWVGNTLLAMSAYPRWEITAYTGPKPVGQIILAEDEHEVHVGKCIFVVGQYVLPEFRNLGISVRFMREASTIARTHGHTVLAFTHRRGPWKYQTNYRRIK